MMEVKDALLLKKNTRSVYVLLTKGMRGQYTCCLRKECRGSVRAASEKGYRVSTRIISGKRRPARRAESTSFHSDGIFPAPERGESSVLLLCVPVFRGDR